MSNTRLWQWTLCLGLLITDQIVWAEAAPAEPTIRSLQALDRSQAAIENSVLNIANWVDSFFGNNRVYQESQGSYLKVALIRNQELHSKPVYSATVRGKLALPKTEDRFKLLLETDPENLDTENQPHTLGDTLDSQEQTLGLRYVPLSDHQWRFTSDAGVRYRSGADGFVRLRLRRLFDFDNWSLRLAETAFWYQSTGGGATSHLEIDWPLSKALLFRSASYATWTNDTDNTELGHDFLLYQQLQTYRYLRYQLGVRGLTEPETHATDYIVSLRYRQRIHRDWLFFELNPKINYPEDRDFEPVKSVILALEVVFADN